MHQPRPYGLHAIGLPLTEKDDAFIVAVTKRITSLRGISKIDSIKMVYDLPDGGYVIVQDMGGNFRVISHKPIHGKDPIFDGIETDYIPMLFSGVVTKAVVHENEGVDIKLTEAARFRLVNYNYLAVKPLADISLMRFRIDYNNTFFEFKLERSGVALKTQYDQQRATWYSGAMSEVVQIVGGYGRQDFANLPNEKVNPFERARLNLPKEWLDKVNDELLGLRLPAYTGIPPNDGAFQFDYRFNKTNAVGFDDSGLPWLLQIGSNGVWAMPLPIVPATRTIAFRRYMELVDDKEMLAIIYRFGGMPSGESFPTGKSFESWRRAGAVIKVCDTSDFYSHIAYSSACGWSINSSGNEGYNTCYDYYDDEGLGYGLTYKLRLSLVSSPHYYGAERVDLVDRGPIADKVRSYLQQLIADIGSTNDDRAILYKLRRAKSKDIYQRALGRTGKGDRDYWDKLEIPPIANHKGKVSEVYRGYLYHPAKRESQPQIKFPEPLINGCMSHDFLPLANGVGKTKYPNSDTIMFAYYVGNQLKVVKYFVDWNSFSQKTEGNFEDVMTVGSWWETQTSGPTAIQGNFYSTDIDDRDFVAPMVTTTRIVGKDLGFDSVPFFEFDSRFASSGTVFRYRYYSHKTTVQQRQGNSLEIAVCIPYLCRNSVIHAYKETTEVQMDSEGKSTKFLLDPTTYRYWTYDPIWAWYNNTITDPKGQPAPLHGNPVWVEEEYYNPSSSNSFADNGSWITSLPANYTWLIHPNSNEWLVNGGGGPPKIEDEFSRVETKDKTTGRLSMAALSWSGVLHTNIPRQGYYESSPTKYGSIFKVAACEILFGEASYGNVEEPNSQGGRAKWGYSNLVDNTTVHCFIGVINE